MRVIPLIGNSKHRERHYSRHQTVQTKYSARSTGSCKISNAFVWWEHNRISIPPIASTKWTSGAMVHAASITSKHSGATLHFFSGTIMMTSRCYVSTPSSYRVIHGNITVTRLNKSNPRKQCVTKPHALQNRKLHVFQAPRVVVQHTHHSLVICESCNAR